MCKLWVNFQNKEEKFCDSSDSKIARKHTRSQAEGFIPEVPPSLWEWQTVTKQRFCKVSLWGLIFSSYSPKEGSDTVINYTSLESASIQNTCSPEKPGHPQQPLELSPEKSVPDPLPGFSRMSITLMAPNSSVFPLACPACSSPFSSCAKAPLQLLYSYFFHTFNIWSFSCSEISSGEKIASS